jgi:two-component system response regulator AtoC
MTSPKRDEAIRVLVVDDDEGFRDALTARLKRKGHDVVATESPRDALAMAGGDQFSVALIDLKMPEMDGITLLKELKTPGTPLEVIVLTGHATVETAIEAMKLGAYDYLTKPFEGAKLDVILEKAYDKARLSRHAQLLESEVERLNRELKERYSFQSLIGRSRPMQDLYDRITAASKTRGNIMILGESGTGKELVARAIHFAGPDATHPFVPVNCAALPHELIESELFGYRKGTFTGATADSPGLFKAAERGTIFLDEITEMAADTQAKLLRVLQEKAIRPVGSTKEVSVNVRVIASTNRDPSQAVAQGKFREDLYYRLAVSPIRIPPLRERVDDIPLLVHHFIQKLNQVYERQVSGVEKAALEVLMGYRWPGNVRELENVIEAAYTFGKTPQVSMVDLPPHLTKDRAPKTAGLPFEGVMPLSEAERMLIIRAMAVFKGNKSHVARALDISRKQLYVKLTTYGIHGPKSSGETDEPDPDDAHELIG